MTKNKRKILALLLVCLLFTACAKTNAPPLTAVTTPTIKTVYEPDYLTLPDGIREISHLSLVGDSVYFLAHTEDGTLLCRMNTDGTDVTELTAFTEPDGYAAVMMCADTDGFWVVDYAENGTDGTSQRLRRLGTDGAEVSSYALTRPVLQVMPDIFGGEASRKLEIATDTDCNVYICDDYDFYAYDLAGNELAHRVFDAENNQTTVFSMDGNVYGMRITMALTVSVAPVNSALRWGDSYQVVGRRAFAGSGEYVYYTDDSAAIYGYRQGSVEGERVLYWVESNLRSRDVTSAVFLPDGKLICAVADGNTGKLAILTAREIEVPPRTVIKLACFGQNVLLNSQIAKFNAVNTEYEISATFYPGFDLESEFRERENINKFNLDIISGNTPDIICANGDFPEYTYTSKGLLEDLYPFIDADPELSRDSFVPGVLNALDSNGKLYQLTDTFQVWTMLGDESRFGGSVPMSFDDYFRIMNAVPSGEIWMDGYKTGDVLLKEMLSYMSFIDWDTGECFFDSQEFIQLLEFTNRPDSYGELTLQRSYKTVISSATLNSIFTVRGNASTEGRVYVGYPGVSGNGSVFKMGSTLSIFSGSQHKDAAWQFIRDMMMPGYQPSVAFIFPTNLDAYNTVSERAMTDADNPVSREDNEKILELVSGITARMSVDLAIRDIVLDEAKNLYNGRKSASDVAAAVQRRALNYVSERK